MPPFHLAQVNIARMRGALDDPIMKGFVDRLAELNAALWWVPAGHRPSIDEAKQRLAHLEAHGPSQFAFTFTTVHEPDETFIRTLDRSRFLPCPA